MLNFVFKAHFVFLGLPKPDITTTTSATSGGFSFANQNKGGYCVGNTNVPGVLMTVFFEWEALSLNKSIPSFLG